MQNILLSRAPYRNLYSFFCSMFKFLFQLLRKERFWLRWKQLVLIQLITKYRVECCVLSFRKSFLIYHVSSIPLLCLRLQFVTFTVTLKVQLSILLMVFFTETGSDIAGVVVDLGYGVAKFKKGDKIVAMLGSAVSFFLL